MKTASFLSYHSFNMHADYLYAVKDETETLSDAPLDFGSIDAPSCIAAGGRKSYEYAPGRYTTLTILAARGQA
jgi:hypothetical protein